VRDGKSPWGCRGSLLSVFTLHSAKLSHSSGDFFSVSTLENATGLFRPGLPESALASGIQPLADSLDLSSWPAAFSMTENRK
jgi:hypothetical protein